MSRPALEVADIFRDHGATWRSANRGHVSLGQLKVMSAIEGCRTAALGGHVTRCENEACGHTVIAYNSCRNRHCPKCQGSQAWEWLEARKAELLEVPYFHVVFTLPPKIAVIAYQNANANVEVGRFKGLGEMMPAQLKETTMDPKKRTLLKVMLVPEDRADTQRSVERLMGTKAEGRFDFIQERAEFASTEMLDV